MSLLLVEAVFLRMFATVKESRETIAAGPM
jgi:hypothetical protein